MTTAGDLSKGDLTSRTICMNSRCIERVAISINTLVSAERYRSPNWKMSWLTDIKLTRLRAQCRLVLREGSAQGDAKSQTHHEWRAQPASTPRTMLQFHLAIVHERNAAPLRSCRVDVAIQDARLGCYAWVCVPRGHYLASRSPPSPWLSINAFKRSRVRSDAGKIRRRCTQPFFQRS